VDPDELLKLLDLSAKPARPPDGAPPSAADDATSPEIVEPKSPTALRIDEWGLRRGRDLVAESERLRQAGADEFAAADFFAAGFEPEPTLLGSCTDRRRHQFLSQLLDTPEYRALHADTRLDDTAAAIAAGHFAGEFARLKNDEAGGPAPPTMTGEGDLAGEMAALRAVGRALTEARKEVDELKDAAAALGLGPGQPGNNDPRAIAELYKRVRNDPALRRICELAGRFRRVAQSKQRQKAVRSVGYCPPSWRGSRCPSWSSTPCGGSSSGRPCVGNTTRSNRRGRDRSSWSATNPGRWKGARRTRPRRWRWHWHGWPGGSGGGRA
jgi:hypothetical protein